MSGKCFLFIMSLFFILHIHAHDEYCPLVRPFDKLRVNSVCVARPVRRSLSEVGISEVGSVGRRLGRDFLTFQKNLFTVPTVEIIAIFTPFYTMARIFDKPLHKKFYCFPHHKNRHQMPNGLYYSLEAALGTSIVVLMGLSFIGQDSPRKRTAQLYTVTMPCLWILKIILKQIHFKGALRPPNGCFRRCKYYGGFPSGHMFEMSYTAALFGTQLGPKYSVPLGILAGLIGLDFMNCNRHYLSQLVAGAGLGFIFASAANRALDIPDNRMTFACLPEREGIAFRATYNF
jgi:membrane-associated phospholipid phosphatase